MQLGASRTPPRRLAYSMPHPLPEPPSYNYYHHHPPPQILQAHPPVHAGLVEIIH